MWAMKEQLPEVPTIAAVKGAVRFERTIRKGFFFDMLCCPVEQSLDRHCRQAGQYCAELGVESSIFERLFGIVETQELRTFTTDLVDEGVWYWEGRLFNFKKNRFFPSAAPNVKGISTSMGK